MKDESSNSFVHALRLSVSKRIHGNHARLETTAQAENRFADLEAATADLRWETDTKGRLTFVSNDVTALLGYAPTEIVGRYVWRLMPRKDVPDARIRFGTLVLSGEPLRDVDADLLHKDKKLHHVRTIGMPIRDHAGDVVGYRGLARDVTQIKVTEEQLRMSEERLRLALSATSDGLWDWDLRTGAVYRSPRYFQLTGYADSEAAPDFAFFKQLIHPDDLPHVLSNIDTHRLEPSSALEFDFRMITRSGVTRWMRVRGYAVERDSSAVAIRMLGTLSDVTLSRAEEQAREQQNEELSRRNAELERFNRATVGREIDMIAIKRQVNALSVLLGRTPPYALKFVESDDVPVSHLAL